MKSSLEQDEKVNFDKSSLRSHYKNGDRTVKIYTWNLLSYNMQRILPDFLFSRSPAATTKITLQEGLSAWGFGVLFSLVFFAVVNFAFFLLGRKLGLIVYIFIAMLFGGIYGAVSSLKGMEFLMAGDKTMIFIIGIPIGILFVVISFFLSLACYKKRYS